MLTVISRLSFQNRFEFGLWLFFVLFVLSFYKEHNASCVTWEKVIYKTFQKNFEDITRIESHSDGKGGDNNFIVPHLPSNDASCTFWAGYLAGRDS